MFISKNELDNLTNKIDSLNHRVKWLSEDNSRLQERIKLVLDHLCLDVETVYHHEKLTKKK